MSGERVLVIEDDAANSELLANRLLADGMEPTLTGSASEGLARAELDRFDAVVLDLRLPDADGLDVLATLRARYPGLPVVVITAHGSPLVAQDALERGATRFLLKPVGRRELLAAIREAIAE